MRFVAVDVETGGLVAGVHPLLEIGYVRWDNHETQMFEGHIMLPFDRDDCDEEAMKVNKIFERIRTNTFSPTSDEQGSAELLLHDWKDAQIVASPSFFDLSFINYWLHTLSLQPSWSHRGVIDLKSLYQGSEKCLSVFKNSRIAAELEVPDTSDHTALEDAKFTMAIFRKIVEGWEVKE